MCVHMIHGRTAVMLSSSQAPSPTRATQEMHLGAAGGGLAYCTK